METDGYLAKLLADLPESLARDEVFVSELKNITTVVAVDKGDYLLRTGEICQDAYFINKGLFINLYVSEKGDECVTGFSSDYQYPFLSAIGYFTQAPSVKDALFQLAVPGIADSHILSNIFVGNTLHDPHVMIIKVFDKFFCRTRLTDGKHRIKF